MTTETVPLTDARSNLSNLVTQVASTGQPVTIAVNGVPRVDLVPSGTGDGGTEVVELLMRHPELYRRLPALHRRGLADHASLTALADARMPGGAPCLDYLSLLPEPPVTLADAITAMRVGPKLLAEDSDWARAADQISDALTEAYSGLTDRGHIHGEPAKDLALHFILKSAHAGGMSPQELLEAARTFAAAGLSHAGSLYKALQGVPADILQLKYPLSWEEAPKMVEAYPELTLEQAYDLMRTGLTKSAYDAFRTVGVADRDRIAALMAAGLTSQHAAWAARDGIAPEEWAEVFADVPRELLWNCPMNARVLRRLLDDGYGPAVEAWYLGDSGLSSRYGAGMDSEASEALIRAGVPVRLAYQTGILESHGAKATGLELADKLIALHQAGITDPEWMRRAWLNVRGPGSLKPDALHYITLYRSGLTQEEWDRLPDRYTEADDILSQLAMLRCPEQLKAMRAAVAEATLALKQMYEKTTGAEKRLLAFFDVGPKVNYNQSSYLSRPSYWSFLELRDFLQGRPAPRAQMNAAAITALLAAIDALVLAVGVKAAELVKAAMDPDAGPVGNVVMPPDHR